jgi:hypothetical protein
MNYYILRGRQTHQSLKYRSDPLYEDEKNLYDNFEYELTRRERERERDHPIS